VCITIRDDTACFDFAGSGAVHAGNLNATRAIVQSAVIYFLRLLLDRPLPLNEGLLAAVRLNIPEGLLNPRFDAAPERCPAVVGGNVETSQRVVDTLIRALGIAACSQGTMNNLIFGNDRYGYYETIGGGAGATPDGPGASGLHTHMTNTRITDPEVLENRYPVRLERFALRRGSGGAGRFCGGEGLIREITFLEPAALSMLTQHRIERPFGLCGGAPGLPGRQTIFGVDGTSRALGGIDSAELSAGDRLRIETPGGGGWGER
jgi:5-oxoprolinase (ATP-hydrolysing)